MLYRNFSAQEELDAQYNLRAAVPDFPRYAELYERESRKAREELECRLDVPFGPTLAERLDVFPAAREGAPVLLFFHGGYWHSLPKEEFSFVARGPVSAGVNTVVVEPRLVPRLGSRHVTAASVFEHTNAVTVVVSESSLIRMFDGALWGGSERRRGRDGVAVRCRI